MQQTHRRRLTDHEREARARQRHEARANATYREFVKDVCRRAAITEEFAERATLSVLGLLEDRIVSGEADDLQAQLPSKLQELVAAREPHNEFAPRDIDRDQLIATVAEELRWDPSEVEVMVRAVFATLTEHVPRGELRQVLEQLPSDWLELWPAEAIAH